MTARVCQLTALGYLAKSKEYPESEHDKDLEKAIHFVQETLKKSAPPEFKEPTRVPHCIE